MSHREGLFQWIEQVSTHVPHLSTPQAVVLALWSFGIPVTRSTGITTVSVFLAMLTGKTTGSLRQRLREWCYDAPDKRGPARQAVEVTACFPSLLRWVLRWWRGDEQRLAMVVATLWVVSLGSEPLPLDAPAGFGGLPVEPTLSCFRRGWLTLLALLLSSHTVPWGAFRPFPWPNSMTYHPLC